MDEHSGRGRGWGPFSGRQLTTIVCVGIVSLVLIPTAALAATGVFTSTTATPAVSGQNSSTAVNAKGVQGLANGTGSATRFGVVGTATGTAGVGVRGSGPAYGVYSNGTLGVAVNSFLTCTGCVTTADLAATAKQVQPLATGETESGAFGDADSYPALQKDVLITPINLIRPVSGTVLYEVGPSTHCTAAGTATAGYLCLYPTSSADVTLSSTHSVGSPVVGTVLIWNEGGGGTAYVWGSYTVAAS